MTPGRGTARFRTSRLALLALFACVAFAPAALAEWPPYGADTSTDGGGDNPLATSFTFSGNVGLAFDVQACTSVCPAGNFTIAGIPGSATVLRSLMYFQRWNAPLTNGSATLAGNPLGPAAAFSVDPAFGFDLQAYRFDVTGIVTGNGVYSYSINTGGGQNYYVALIVVYSDASEPSRVITINDGSEALGSNASSTTTFAGQPAGNGVLTVVTQADDAGGGTADELQFNGATVLGPGHLWNANLGNFASLRQAAVTTVAGVNTSTMVTTGDLFGWHLAILSVEIPCPPDPDPVSQGYWHRQCLGLSASDPDCPGIDPGRNGRGPQEPTEPGFCPDLVDCADMRLEDVGLFGLATCDGMNADPSNDPCEKAKKQLTALILNVCSERLADGCEVDVSAEGCTSTDVGTLIQEVADLIDAGDCTTAAACADAVNTGSGLTDSGGGGSAFESHDPDTPSVVEPVDPGEPTRRPKPARDRTQRWREARRTAAETRDAGVEPAATPAPEDRILDRHMDLLSRSSTSERARRASTEVLVEALGQGHAAGRQLEITGTLIPRVDASLLPLLAEHVSAIREEAAETGDRALEKKAQRQLRRIEARID